MKQDIADERIKHLTPLYFAYVACIDAIQAVQNQPRCDDEADQTLDFELCQLEAKINTIIQSLRALNPAGRSVDSKAHVLFDWSMRTGAWRDEQYGRLADMASDALAA